jgi:hypothetical protein
MGAICQLFQGFGGVTQVAVVVLEIISSANNNNFKTIHHNRFSDAGVKYWAFSFGVGANKNEKISFINPCDHAVHQIAGSEVRIKMGSVGSDVKIVTV